MSLWRWFLMVFMVYASFLCLFFWDVAFWVRQILFCIFYYLYFFMPFFSFCVFTKLKHRNFVSYFAFCCSDQIYFLVFAALPACCCRNEEQRNMDGEMSALKMQQKDKLSNKDHKQLQFLPIFIIQSDFSYRLCLLWKYVKMSETCLSIGQLRICKYPYVHVCRKYSL